jgi:hypothetical protein
MASKNDDVCKDSSKIGFPFLVETWNEQPLLTEILDSCLGYYEAHSVPESSELTSEQKQFREVEISKARFLNHSIVAFVSSLENKQEQEDGFKYPMIINNVALISAVKDAQWIE